MAQQRRRPRDRAELIPRTKHDVASHGDRTSKDRAGTDRTSASLDPVDPHESRIEGFVARTDTAPKGFVFLKALDGREYFCHRSMVDCEFDALVTGRRVTFRPEMSTKGWRAIQTRLAQEE